MIWGELTYLSQGMQLSFMNTHSQKPAKKNSFLFKKKNNLEILTTFGQESFYFNATIDVNVFDSAAYAGKILLMFVHSNCRFLVQCEALSSI